MKQLAIALAALALSAPLALGQDPAAGSLEQRLDEQQRELDALREELRRLRAGGAGDAPDPLAPAPAEEPATPIDAEPAPAPDASAPDHDDPPIKLGLFYVESPDGRHRLQLNGRVMADARFVPERDHDDLDDGFQVRRARVTVSGAIYEHITFRMGFEFGRTSDADLRDAFVNLGFLEWAQLRAGQMLPPFSTERHTSSNVMKHPERPIIVAHLVEPREVGLMLHGKLLDGLVTYYAGVFNGNGQNTAKDNDDAKDGVVRLEVAPLQGVLLAASYWYTPANRDDAHGPADYHTVGNQLTTFLDYATGAGGNRQLGPRERGTLDARVRWAWFQLKGELIFDYHRDVISPTAREADLLNWSWFVDASWVLTGEDCQDTIEPADPFWGEHGFGTGAFELSLRYEELHADPATIRGGFAVGARAVRATTATLTWIPVARVRAMLSYTYSDFDSVVTTPDGDRRDDDHAILGRIGVWF